MASLVSIIIPTYNRAHLIGETLNSVLAQTYTNWECIIVDDGSTDNTDEVVDEYLKKDKRFQYHHRPKDRLPGGNAARNYGFELSKGEFINWFDSDDLMHKNLVLLKMKAFKSSEIDFVFCNNKVFIKKTDCLDGSISSIIKKSSSKNIYNYILGKLFFPTPGPLWRKKSLDKAVLFNENLRRGQESDFHFKQLIRGLKFKFLDEKLYFIRRGIDGISTQSKESQEMIVSTFDYYFSVFEWLMVNNTYEKNKLKKYLVYRLLPIYSKLSFYKKIKVLYKCLFTVFNIKTSSYIKFKLILGLILLLFFNKGYKLVYLPQFDIRND